MKRLCVGVTALSALAFHYGCDNDPESHVYVAAQYDAVADCFGPSTSLGYVQTPDGDLDCAPTCIVSTSTTSSDAEVYVSTMCGPYPPGYDTSQTNAACPAALAAWPAEQQALVDGTSSCASPAGTAEPDGGDDSGSADDASGPG